MATSSWVMHDGPLGTRRKPSKASVVDRPKQVLVRRHSLGSLVSTASLPPHLEPKPGTANADKRSKSKPAVALPCIGDEGGPTSLVGQAGTVRDFLEALIPKKHWETVPTKPLRLPQLEAQRRLAMFPQKLFEEIAESERENETLGVNEMKDLMKRLYGVDIIDQKIVREALKTAVVKGDASDREKTKIDVKKFGRWYVKNMMRDVTAGKLDGQDENTKVLKKFSERYKVGMKTMQKIGDAFGDTDTNGSGFIEFDEFVELVKTSLRAIAGDLTQKKIMNLWNSIDANHNGVVEFEEYVEWYIKYLLDKGGKMKDFSLEERINSYHEVPPDEDECEWDLEDDQ
eukprot:TRINITY_DN81561_c0_g1_i1.p1 TRINITY_DN81561_c0_g1~~TRINITY_DN81561_c0_g1_i1.p1  ORF type:complete len:343 (-),score=106.30 TRINITY_DN81561_c0_g1_i1:49-1077(-)